MFGNTSGPSLGAALCADCVTGAVKGRVLQLLRGDEAAIIAAKASVQPS